MRPAFILSLLLIVLLSACTSGDDAQTVVLPPGLPSPAVAVRLADDYLDSLSQQPVEAEKDRTRADFVRNFFDGFTTPGASRVGKTEAAQRGFLAGQEYYHANPAKIEEIMKAFGYTATEVEGSWTASFEHSSFYPRDYPSQTWWLSSFGETWSDNARNRRLLENGAPRLQVTGFLSPKQDYYGHPEGYDHEFFATAIIPLDGG
jgi:hypothetical protein